VYLIVRQKIHISEHSSNNENAARDPEMETPVVVNYSGCAPVRESYDKSPRHHDDGERVFVLVREGTRRIKDAEVIENRHRSFRSDTIAYASQLK